MSPNVNDPNTPNSNTTTPMGSILINYGAKAL